MSDAIIIAMTNSLKPNHLINEGSPYLKQHAHNPVDWYPWGPDALEKARRENKPILLSIGYAACHWCHVMAHESFEDNETAQLMNQLFINIKVDREERPDLDKIYQTAHYLLTEQSGGWPLTIFLTPDDLTPFFSGTYFPRESRYQLPAFKDVLQGVANLYQDRIADIKQQNAGLHKILQHKAHALSQVKLTNQPIESAIETLKHQYDPVNGGFNGAPKFPQPIKLAFLLQNESTITIETLYHMSQGGIYDQLAGGFFRYSVDAHWQIPHFEKMLYDNGQLLSLYAQVTKDNAKPSFTTIARETAEWVIHHMQAPLGGYYSSIDADSEGHEGKCYVWNKTEVEALLNQDEYAIVNLYYGFNQAPNFETHWHLHIAKPLASVATHLNMSLIDAENMLQKAKIKMLAARNKRIPPARDDKILTAWNGLMIKGMLTAGDVLNEPRFIASAEKAIAFIQKHLWVNHRLLASYNNDRAYLSAYLDDYAFLTDALLTSLELTWNSNHLHFAKSLMDTLLIYFADPESGGFYFTATDHEKLLYRPKTMMDEAIPAGNSIAVRVLLLLGYFLGETRYLDAAENTLKAAWPALLQYPSEHCGLLLGLHQFLTPPQIIVIRGHEEEMKVWKEVCKTRHNIVFTIPANAKNLPEALDTKKFIGKTCAYVCQGMQCLDVIEDLERLRVLVQE